MVKEKTSGGKFKTSSRGPLSGRVRFGEEDKETRGSGRHEVTMLPARRAIINVYQLFTKSLKEGTGGKINIGVGKKPRQSGIYHFRDSDISSGQTVDGVDLNTYMLPFKRQGEVSSEYNPRVAKFIRDHKEFYIDRDLYTEITGKKTASDIHVKFKGKLSSAKEAKEQAEKEAESLAKRRAEHMKSQSEDEKKLWAQHTNDPPWILWKLARENKIPMPSNSMKIDKSKYREYSDTDADYALIRRYIEAAKAKGYLPQKPGAFQHIIAVKPSLEYDKPPTRYYISNDIFAYSRKKRMSHSSVRRRSAKPRKVVMKRRGGKR